MGQTCNGATQSACCSWANSMEVRTSCQDYSNNPQQYNMGERFSAQNEVIILPGTSTVPLRAYSHTDLYKIVKL